MDNPLTEPELTEILRYRVKPLMREGSELLKRKLYSRAHEKYYAALRELQLTAKYRQVAKSPRMVIARSIERRIRGSLEEIERAVGRKREKMQVNPYKEEPDIYFSPSDRQILLSEIMAIARKGFVALKAVPIVDERRFYPAKIGQPKRSRVISWSVGLLVDPPIEVSHSTFKGTLPMKSVPTFRTKAETQEWASTINQVFNLPIGMAKNPFNKWNFEEVLDELELCGLVWDIGQLSTQAIRKLSAMARKGQIIKEQGIWPCYLWGTVRKTIYYMLDFPPESLAETIEAYELRGLLEEG